MARVIVGASGASCSNGWGSDFSRLLAVVLRRVRRGIAQPSRVGDESSGRSNSVDVSEGCSWCSDTGYRRDLAMAAVARDRQANRQTELGAAHTLAWS